MSDLIIESVSCKRHQDLPCTAIKVTLEPVEKDLGGFSVRRLLPTSELRSVGPFIFFDHLGPAIFAPGKGVDVRPHPHIGLATITYVFAGEILHRDSLGAVQPIRPNELNWMTAGKGIAHSERTPPDIREQGHTLHALQLWIALPEDQEETDPFFVHYDASDLPKSEEEGCSIRVMVGEAYGLISPVKTHSPTLYVEVALQEGARINLPENVEERAVYVISGQVDARETVITQHTMVVFDKSPGIELVAREESKLVLIGGPPLGKRIMWWNLVSTRTDLLEAAKQAWRDRTFPRVPGETEFIPLPE
jgi:redox-sensitive bicupin YhaK (pirin superfamily)